MVISKVQIRAGTQHHLSHQFIFQTFICMFIVGANVDLTIVPSTILTFGDNVTLTCSARGGPDNVFQWQKNGADLPGENQTTLQLTLVSAADGGEYTCVVSNTTSSDNTTVTLYIRPYIIVNPQQQLLAEVGSSVTFTCQAEAFPSPSYRWEKVDDPGFESSEQNLIVGFISYSDAGCVYRCVAFITVNMTNYTAQSEDGLLIGRHN